MQDKTQTSTEKKSPSVWTKLEEKFESLDKLGISFEKFVEEEDMQILDLRNS